jgi:hypothetical protein
MITELHVGGDKAIAEDTPDPEEICRLGIRWDNAE